MIIQTIWTSSEASNIEAQLRHIYKGTPKATFKKPGTLIKHAIRDFIEIKRQERMYAKGQNHSRKAPR